MWDADKAVLRGKFRALNAYIRKKWKISINNFLAQESRGKEQNALTAMKKKDNSRNQ